MTKWSTAQDQQLSGSYQSWNKLQYRNVCMRICVLRGVCQQQCSWHCQTRLPTYHIVRRARGRSCKFVFVCVWERKISVMVLCGVSVCEYVVCSVHTLKMGTVGDWQLGQTIVLHHKKRGKQPEYCCPFNGSANQLSIRWVIVVMVPSSPPVPQ